MIEAILWDNDGVLVDTERLYFQATQQVMASAGVELTEALYIEHFLVEGRGAWHLLEERGATEAEVGRLRDERNGLYGRWLQQGARLIPGITETLEELNGKYVMGIVTSSRRDHFDLIHANTGLLRYFDFVLASGDYPRGKPHPDPYLAAVKRSGVAAEVCVAVEDSERGLTAATCAGLRCLVVPTGLTRGGRFERAHRVLESVKEIPEAVRSADL
jgi:HAD superfamily hydrolase (TIGR01509 family)